MQPVSKELVKVGLVQWPLLNGVRQAAFLRVNAIKVQRIRVAQNQRNRNVIKTIHGTKLGGGECHADR